MAVYIYGPILSKCGPSWQIRPSGAWRLLERTDVCSVTEKTCTKKKEHNQNLDKSVSDILFIYFQSDFRRTNRFNIESLFITLPHGTTTRTTALFWSGAPRQPDPENWSRSDWIQPSVVLNNVSRKKKPPLADKPELTVMLLTCSHFF